MKFQQQYLTYITHKEEKIVFTYKGKKLNINNENTVNAGMIDELEFNKEATSIIRTLKANKNLK